MTAGLPRASILDVGTLPVADIARIAAREGARPRPAYQAHKWFARRFAATARSLLVAATTPAQSNFWRAYYSPAECGNLTVLDPFMGGGVMLLEAARLGAGIVGVDVEPVAAAVSDFQGRLWDLPELAPALADLKRDVGAALEPYYTSHDQDGRRARLLHAFWVQSVPCAGCGEDFDAHPTFRFAWSEAEDRQWVACRQCSRVLEGRLSAKTLSCQCGVRTVAAARRCERGKAACPRCRHVEPLIDCAKRTGPPRFRMFAVEVIPEGPERRFPNKARVIRSAGPNDTLAYAEAEKALARLLEEDAAILPLGPIPVEGRSDDRLVRYGYRDYGELFNARQKLHLAMLSKALCAIPDERLREAMQIAFSDHLATNNMMCGYAGGWRRLSPLFAIRAYRHIARPVEINPWLEHNGRGTFPNAIRSVQRAAASLHESCEPSVVGPARKVPLARPASWDIRCCDARNLAHVASSSIDLVLTDPPYFDYIAYSELGHFFVPWLAKFGLLRCADPHAFPKGQLAAHRRREADADAFAHGLGLAMKEIARVTKPEGRIAFTYQNLDGRGWRALASAMAGAGIVPLTAFPMFGDGAAGLHKHVNSISWDCVLVCTVEGAIEELSWPSSARAGENFAAKWRKIVERAGFELSPGDLANFHHVGVLLEGFSRSLRKRAAG